MNEYTWKEAEALDGYTLTNTKKEGRLTTLTNTHTPATIEASVEKTWDDNDDRDGKRPEKLFVTLMRRIREQAVPISLDDADDADTNPAEEVKTVELTAANDWKARELESSEVHERSGIRILLTEKMKIFRKDIS